MTVFQSFREKIEEIVPISDEEFSGVIMMTTIKKLKKNEYFIQEGDFCDHIPFINYGLTKTCFCIHGVDYICEFNVAGECLGTYDSYLTKTPSAFSIQALEDTELFLFGHDTIQKLYSKNQKFERFGRLIAQRRTLSHIQAKFFLLSSPEERYRQVMAEKPELFNRVPLKEIAYYIGVTAESLSRIRKRVATF